VKHGKTNATIPKEKDPLALTLEEAIALLDARAGAPKKKGRGAARSKSAATTTAVRKTAKPKAEKAEPKEPKAPKEPKFKKKKK
jgi:DNA topoisomerase-1